MARNSAPIAGQLREELPAEELPMTAAEEKRLVPEEETPMDPAEETHSVPAAVMHLGPGAVHLTAEAGETGAEMPLEALPGAAVLLAAEIPLVPEAALNVRQGVKASQI